MALKVEIYEKNIVRPFSPTPESLRNYNLSFCDQKSGNHYIPIVFFYNSGSYDELKESLSKTLSILYPVAGRVKDGMTIECNDKGVDFVGANVTNYDLADFLRLPNVHHLLEPLLPCEPFPMDFDHSRPMLAVQVNKFRCGGMAVAICIWHGVADGAALAGFVQTWAAINRGEGEGEGGLISCIVDATNIFPPRPNFDFSSSTSSYATGRKMILPKYSTKRFIFTMQEIERIRNEHNISDHHHRPTRVEALSAFIWAAVIRANMQANQNPNIYMLIHLVDLRKRMNPPFLSMCLGNIIYGSVARWENDATGIVTSQSLIRRIREATMKVTDDYMRKIQPEAEMAKIVSDGNATKFFVISSFCSFPFHESDFGWGKPIWFALPSAQHDGAYFWNTIDGGIEVWIGLTHQVMSNLDNDNEFLAHVSSSSQITPKLRMSMDQPNP